jgi:hypothetical protein
MRRWRDWYAYEVGGHVLRLLQHAEIELSSSFIDEYLDYLSGIGGSAAALSFLEVGEVRAKGLIKKLSKACRKTTKVDFHETFDRERPNELGAGLRKAAALALLLESPTDALAISRRAPHDRPRLWSFRDYFADRQVFSFLFHTALVAAAKGTELREKDIMPSDLAGISKGMKNDLEPAEFRKKFKERLEKRLRAKKEGADSEADSVSYEQKSEAERFLGDRLEPLLTLTRALAGLLGAPKGKADRPFAALLVLRSTVG